MRSGTQLSQFLRFFLPTVAVSPYLDLLSDRLFMKRKNNREASFMR